MLTKHECKIANAEQNASYVLQRYELVELLLALESSHCPWIAILNIYNFSYVKINPQVTKVTRRRPKLGTVECLYPPK